MFWIRRKTYIGCLFSRSNLASLTHSEKMSMLLFQVLVSHLILAIYFHSEKINVLSF